MTNREGRRAVAIIATACLLNSVEARALEAQGLNAPGPAFLVVEGDTLWLAEPLVIVGSRVPVALPGIVRPVRVVDAADLESAPVRSVGEALQAVPGVIVGQRQQYGVQGDLTIRGSTFDQVLVLIDGFAAGDPQTGHHLLDLPMGLADVERLEVLPGHGSALYGAGAFGGTLNVATKQPAGRNGGEVALSGGGDGTWSARGSLDLAAEGDAGRKARLSLETFGTDGHDETAPDGSSQWAGADARSTTATWRDADRWGRWELETFAGFADRQFGARDFYAPYPSYEATRAFMGWTRARGKVTPWLTLEPRLSLRAHRDRFWLLRDQPGVYENDHLTRRVAGEVRGLVELGCDHSLAVGVEGTYEDIDSEGVRGGVAAPALGYHVRRQAALSAELDRHGERLRWQAGLRVDGREGMPSRGSGSAAASWAFPAGLSARAGIGSAYRIPTFTDLYYVDPANQGNPDLLPESGWTWDAGLTLERDSWWAGATWFERREEDRIEWARAAGETIWRVLNVAEATVRGAETQVGWRHARGHSASLGWTWLEIDTALTEGYEGKYALLAPRQVISAQGRAALPFSLVAGAAFRYLTHSDGPDPFRYQAVLDLRADWTSPDGWFAGLLLTNVLDRERQEIPGVSLAGRLLTSSVGRRF
jgi:iron complex outermembrane receptor protein